MIALEEVLYTMSGHSVDGKQRTAKREPNIMSSVHAPKQCCLLRNIEGRLQIVHDISVVIRLMDPVKNIVISLNCVCLPCDALPRRATGPLKIVEMIRSKRDGLVFRADDFLMW